MGDLDIVKQYDLYYQDAYNVVNSFYARANEDLRYYLGDQWSDEEKRYLFEEGRNALVFNYVKRNIDLIDGYQRKNRLSSVVVPVENSDQLTADQFSQLLLYVMQYGNGYENISDCFSGANKTGMNLATLWVDYREDPINGDIRFGREPYSGFILDPYFTQLDLSDCSYIIRRKYLSHGQVRSLLPRYAREIDRLYEIGWTRDDKFTWLPYQRQPGGKEYMAYDEMFEQKWKNVNLIVDEETGEYTEWDGKDERLRDFLDLYPNLKIVKKPKRYVEQHIIVNGEYIKTAKDPYGLNEYPFVPFVGIFEPEGETWDLKVQSLIRCQKDPQRESNMRRSQMIDILDSQINSGWIVDENGVINPRTLFQSSQGKVIWKKKGAELVKIPPAQIPPSSFQIQELFDKDMMQILGVNDAAFGATENAQESGIMYMLRQGASLVNLQGVFDRLRFAQKQISKKVLKLVQNWTPEKVARVLNQQPSQQFYNKEFTKYDISVQEGVLTDTQRQMYFRQLVDLKQLGVPVTGEMLASAAPLQNKSEYNKQIEQIEQQQAQAQQQQQQVEQQLLGAQMQQAQAKAISDVSLAKERFTRAVANMGLQEERNSEAVQNRAQAALERAKAIKELDSMDDDRLVKYLNIIRMMEEMSKRDEQEAKSEDVLITESSEKLNAAFPAPQTQVSESNQINQPLEV